MRGPLRLTKDDMMKRIKNAGIGSAIHATDVLDVVKKVITKEFDEEIAKTVQPLFFRHGTVTIRTSSSIIAQEIRLTEDELKKRINESLGKEIVTHFLWRVE